MSSGGTGVTAKTEKATPFREYVQARPGFRNHWYPTLFSEPGFPFPERPQASFSQRPGAYPQR